MNWPMENVNILIFVIDYKINFNSSCHRYL